MKRAVVMNGLDNVCVCMENVCNGDTVNYGTGSLIALDDVNMAHKIAIKDIARGHKIMKYGQPIGYAMHDIKCGQWVHVHNVSPDSVDNQQEDQE